MEIPAWFDIHAAFLHPVIRPTCEHKVVPALLGWPACSGLFLGGNVRGPSIFSIELGVIVREDNAGAARMSARL
jgi:hypothetical protein